jgi:hypothetical protein
VEMGKEGVEVSEGVAKETVNGCIYAIDYRIG